MTDTREGDPCHEEHQALQVEVGGIKTALDIHTAEVHAELMSREEIIKRDRKALELTGDVVDELLGPRKGPLHGEEREHERGLSYKVDVMWEQSRNGGIPAKLSRKTSAIAVGLYVVLEAISKVVI